MANILSKFNWKTLLWIFLIVWNVSGIIVSIYSAGVYYNNTGDYKPLLDSTAGRIFASNVDIINSIQIMKANPDSLPVADYFRQRIIQDLFIMIIFFIILYYILKQILKFMLGLSEEQLSPRHTMLFVGISIFVFLLLMEIYSVVFGFGLTNPVGGLMGLYGERDIVWGSGKVMLEGIKSTTQTIINNSTNMVAENLTEVLGAQNIGSSGTVY